MDGYAFVFLFSHILKRRPLSCAVYYRPDTIRGHDTHRDCQPARTADIAADERWPFVRCLVMAVADCWMEPAQVGAGSWVLRASAARKAQRAHQLPSQRSISLLTCTNRCVKSTHGVVALSSKPFEGDASALQERARDWRPERRQPARLALETCGCIGLTNLDAF